MAGLSEAFDPRVMDPATEEAWWRDRADRERERAFQEMTLAATNALTGAGTFAASRLRGMPPALRRLGGALGWGQLGVGGLNAGLGYVDSGRYRESQATADRWRQGLPPDLMQMIEEAFRPQVPVSR